MGKKYKLVSVRAVSNNSIELVSTHPDTNQWLYGEVKKHEPSAKYSERVDEGYEANIEMRRYGIERDEITFKLRRFLCDHGWEPLDFMTFRLTEETGEEG